jgi:LmbE family N-acetylglucosaminyl deacetylase
MDNIIFVGSHFDDAELSCAGTMYLLSKKFNVITIITSSSDYTNYNNAVLRTKKQAFVEGTNALKILGCKNVINLGFKTKNVPFNSIIIEKINKLIDIYNPMLIVTHSLGSSHQDHINTSKAVLAASRRCKNIWMWEPIYPDKMSNIPFRPQIYVDITDSVNKKIESLKMHTTQFKKYPNWIDLTCALAKTRGIENGCAFAEAYEPIKMEYKI